MMSRELNFQWWEAFLARWPLDLVKEMTLDEYLNWDNPDSLVYWLEYRLNYAASICGYDKRKFGICFLSDVNQIVNQRRYLSDGTYVWISKFGNSAQDAFQKIKQHIVTVIEKIAQGDLATIEGNDLPHLLKWKIAFHYQSRQMPLLVGVFDLDMLRCYFKAPMTVLSAAEKLKGVLKQENVLSLTEAIQARWIAYKRVRIWQLSQSVVTQSDQEFQWLEQHNYVALAADAAKSAGQQFADTLAVGDFMCISRGSQLYALVQIVSEPEIPPDSPFASHYLLRRYSIVLLFSPEKVNVTVRKEAVFPTNLFSLVAAKDLLRFERECLLPYFNTTLNQLLDLQNKSQFRKSVSAQNVACDHSINRLYVGLSGVGKTRKLCQLAQQYIAHDEAPDDANWQASQFEVLNWRQVLTLCLFDLAQPAGMGMLMAHPYFKQKAQHYHNSAHCEQIAWRVLQQHTVPESVTVNVSSCREPAIFDKTHNGKWFIVDNRRDLLAESVELFRQIKGGPQKMSCIKRFDAVAFHPGYHYADFIEGQITKTNEFGEAYTAVKPGVFLRLCQRAERDPAHRYAMFIDDLHRGNVTEIFGELLSLIESDKYQTNMETKKVTLPYSGQSFSVPNNIDIYATMHASAPLPPALLHRRFEIEELPPDAAFLSGITVAGIDLGELLSLLNQRITFLLSEKQCLGHGFFAPVKQAFDTHGEAAAFTSLVSVFKLHIIPLLTTYFEGDWHRVRLILGDNQKTDIYQFITEKVMDMNNYEALFGLPQDEHINLTKRIYKFNEVAFDCREAYQGIMGADYRASDLDLW